MAKRKISIEPFQIPYEIFDNEGLTELRLTLLEFDFGNSETLKSGFLLKLKNLKTLDLTGIKVSNDIFENEICNLLHLEKLTLMYSRINTIPNEISNLKKLQSVNFRGNEIEELPESFFELQNLSLVNFIDNNFQSIPDGLSKIKSLTSIYIL